MRKIVSLLILLLLVVIPLGCSASKKPEPKQEPRTIVVPDISKITFETVDFDQAPEIVRALGKNMKDIHHATWTVVNGRNYIIVSQKNLPVGSGVQISEIQRRIPANDFDWINVRLKYLSTVPSLANGKKPDLEKPLVATFTIDRPVKALSFELAYESPQAPTKQTAPQTTPVPVNPSKGSTVDKGLKLDSPKPGELIKSPVQIVGTATGIQGALRVRLKDASGLTLAEKPVQSSGGKFNTTISFSSPAAPEKGTIEAFVIGDSGVEKDMVSVPINLQPSTTNEPETIGAP